MTRGTPFYGFYPMPWSAPPLAPGASTYEAAHYAQMYGRPTVNQAWLLREVEEIERNRLRYADWAIRFKVLGPLS